MTATSSSRQATPIRLDRDWLSRLGLGALPPSEQQQLLQVVHDRLEYCVGTRLMEALDGDQVMQFEQVLLAEQEDKALTWLKENLPHYPAVVREEFFRLETELRAAAPEILRRSAP